MGLAGERIWGGVFIWIGSLWCPITIYCEEGFEKIKLFAKEVFLEIQTTSS